MIKHNFEKLIFSHHSIVRSRQRIKEIQKNDNELIIQYKLRELLRKIQVHEFDDKHHYYFRIPNVFGMYIVVKKINYLVITITKISDAKKIELLSK